MSATAQQKSCREADKSQDRKSDDWLLLDGPDDSVPSLANLASSLAVSMLARRRCLVCEVLCIGPDVIGESTDRRCHTVHEAFRMIVSMRVAHYSTPCRTGIPSGAFMKISTWAAPLAIKALSVFFVILVVARLHGFFVSPAGYAGRAAAGAVGIGIAITPLLIVAHGGRACF
jgi:hypothetical protein